MIDEIFRQITDSVKCDARKKATSRKREGQLSSKANSCSSYEDANHTTEIEQEDNNPCWDSLPSIILQEIFSYLPHYRRLTASEVCKNWRDALFHPRFWKKIEFVLKDEDSISWARFLKENFGLSVQDVTIRWDTTNHSAHEALAILNKLGCNRQLRKLFLESSSNTFRQEDQDINEYDRYVSALIVALVKIIERSDRLEALSLGCIEGLTVHSGVILTALCAKHAKHLTTLSLASVKDDPDAYDVLKCEDLDYICRCIFNSFSRLSLLTIDYNFVNDTLLEALNSGTMERLVIHVHGWNDNYLGTTDSAWRNFVQKNPKCELRLNLIHSYVGIEMLNTNILCPSMPLTHLKVLFCENVNIRALHLLSTWYAHTLKSLIWIDSMGARISKSATYDPDDPNSPDPLVLVAWKCTKLVEMVFIGHKYSQENMLAIARLRGRSLKSLVFAQRDVAPDDKDWFTHDIICSEIQDILRSNWDPLSDADLPEVVKDPFKGDSREIIMPLVLQDQK
ncbi:F-box only protein 33 [Calliopsis andreniformis]|uniref:F-box only protein 33 n=1 Tax=Calliopsis andreniformis TaxID=337506 RepID=UPI003FCC8B56